MKESERGEEETYFQVYQRIAEDYDDMLTFFSITVDDTEGVENLGKEVESLGFKIYPFFDRQKVKTLHFSRNEDVLIEDFLFYSLPLVEQFSRNSIGRLKSEEKFIVILFEEETEGMGGVMDDLVKSNYLILMEQFAMKMKRREVIPCVGETKEFKNQLINIFGEDNLDFPLILGIDLNKNKKYGFESEEFSVGELSHWVTGVLKREVLPYFKSERIPTPEEQEKLVTKKFVSRNIKSSIGLKDDLEVDVGNDNLGKDIVILFCNNLVPKCHDFYRTYKQISMYLKPLYEKLVIGELNMAKNELAEDVVDKITAFPHPRLIMFTPENKESLEGVMFEGASQEAYEFFGVLEFILKHSRACREDLMELLKNDGVDVENQDFSSFNEEKRLQIVEEIQKTDYDVKDNEKFFWDEL